ncbi:MAG: CDP-alcohol phosphatidyltransferase family protein [Verrucomicrobia bacterium]|nr:CDP-alcohol phosphatidyltransferase family protein [Verrucomicrobiota bacterium]
MTLANKITLVRLGLIPVFVTLAIYYGESVLEKDPEPLLRYGAIAAFLLAAASDGLDGYVARRYNQRTELGAVLDPIADKGLLVSALLVLTFGHWEVRFPVWFLILVLARDFSIVLGCMLIHFINGRLEVRPSWLGKTTTVFQMAAITWVALQLTVPSPQVPIVLAGVFTGLSWVGYLIDGIRQLQTAGSKKPD